MSNESVVVEKVVEVIAVAEQFDEQSEEPPIEEWSSLDCFSKAPHLNKKALLFEEGLYELPSEEICAKYIALSDSSVFRHPYYKYPAVIDPGVENALLYAPPVISYPDDGQELYLALCKEMNEAYCRIFHKQLLEEHMNLAYYGISTYGWRAMAIALKLNRIVKSIDFTSNFISQDGCFHIGDMLATNFTIVELDFTGCRMGPQGVEKIVVHLPSNKTLRKLNLAKNEIIDEGMSYLCTAIYQGSNVTDVNVSNNRLTSKSADYLADALEFTNKMTHLDLSFNSLAVPRPVETLASRFLENDTLEEVNLSWNSLSNRFARAIGYLILCPTIKILNLSNNKLTGDVITTIGSNLKLAKRLKSLNMSYNPMTIDEAKALAGYLKFRAVKLQQLLMDGVNVDENFVKLKQQMLKLKFRKNSVITHGYVVIKFTPTPYDMRDIVLRRAEFLCSKPKKKMVDVGVMLLTLNKQTKGQPITFGDFLYFLKIYGAFQINKDLSEEICAAFPGPKAGKERLMNVAAMASYVRRKWPDARAPPTPPPTPPPPPTPLPKKEKEKKGKK